MIASAYWNAEDTALPMQLIRVPALARLGATPPFSCITSLRYYYDRNLLNRPVLPFF